MSAGVGIINHNITAINSLRTLQKTSMSIDSSLEKLSSGMRINRAADDAAGLAVSEKMRGQLSGLKQSERNSQDGISMIQTAEGVMDTLHETLQRMRQLSVQAANDTYTSYDRRRIQEEMNQLVDEIDRIADQTEFNTKKLCNGDSLGYANAKNERVMTAECVGKVANADYSITILDAGTACNIHGNSNLKDGMDYGNDITLYDIGVRGDEELHIKVNGQTTVIDLEEGDSLSDVTYKINKSGVPVLAGLDQEGNDITITSMHSGSKFNISFADDPNGVALKLGLVGGGEQDLTTYDHAHSISGGDLGHSLFTSGTDTIISITNITRQGQFATEPGNPLSPGGYGKSLGVFRSDSDVFTEKELSHPINTFSTLNALDASGNPVASQIYNSATKQWDDNPLAKITLFPYWNDVSPYAVGDGIHDINDKVDHTQTDLLKGIVIRIDEDIDYGMLQTRMDDDFSLNTTNSTYATNRAGIRPGDFTSAYPNINYTTVTSTTGSPNYDPIFSKRPGDWWGIGQDDHKAAVPGGQTIGGNETEARYYNAVNGKNIFDPSLKGDTTSMWTTRLSIRDNRQKFHIGANEDQTITVDFGNMKSENLGLSWNLRANGTILDGNHKLETGATSKNARQTLSVQTQENAEAAITVIDNALNYVSKQRSNLGAYQNALEKTVKYLSIASENMQSAESRIRDVDMAAEMTDFTKNQVLMQSGTAMLAQANAKPQAIMQLLG